MKNFSAIILAGGKSKRIGKEKPFLLIDNKRLIDIIVDKLKLLFSDIIIVTDKKEKFKDYKNIIVVEDIFKNKGPLSGIYSGMLKSKTKGIFVTACDMPLLNISIIKKLLNYSANNNYSTVIPEYNGFLEPLHAVYSIKILYKIKKEIILNRNLSLKSFLKKTNYLTMKVKENEKYSFFNVNTQQDFLLLLKLIKGNIKL